MLLRLKLVRFPDPPQELGLLSRRVEIAADSRALLWLAEIARPAVTDKAGTAQTGGLAERLRRYRVGVRDCGLDGDGHERGSGDVTFGLFFSALISAL